ncbi:hypothetical protein CPB83DRAFT_603110 [Crepidotus variabilis]|uniref:Uncharacterized protein n=1 Tax=Crepidotus variabilis TaxID=179855 RepID=A0A9P6E8F5_9AGAR|nr:hypothetical protein CPB83DRAFT_603110 [Crepidotus variabilis]
MDNFNLHDRRPILGIRTPGYVPGSREDSQFTRVCHVVAPATYHECMRLAYETAIEGHLPEISARLADVSNQNLASYLKLNISRSHHVFTNEPAFWLELTPTTYKTQVMACTSIGIYSPLFVVRVRPGSVNSSWNARLEKKQELVIYVLLIFSIVMFSFALC